jgi:glyceraldehyde 3-phosphate dehydrogenase
MAVKVGINGSGRIERMVIRTTMEQKNLDMVVINDLTDAATIAHLMAYDSVHGRLAVILRSSKVHWICTVKIFITQRIAILKIPNRRPTVSILS